jgi:Protein of unknown function (DUF2846)
MNFQTRWMKTIVIGLMLVMAAQSTYRIDIYSQETTTAQDEEFVLAEDTAFNIVTAQEISSKKAQPGDTVEFKVDEDVVVKGRVLISKGTKATGFVVNAEKSGMMGKAGKLGITVESTTTVDGKPLKLRAAKGKEGDDKTNSVAALSILVSSLFLLKKGEDAKIKEGTSVKVYVAEEKRFRVVGSSMVAVEATDASAASASTAIENAGAEDFATVYIYRPDKFVGKALEPSVFIDGVELARMDNGRYLMLKVKPGKHIVHMTDKKKGFAIDMGRGQHYYFRIGIEMGMWKGHGKIMLEENEKGIAEVKKLKPLGNDKIKDKTMVVVAEAKQP